MDKEYFEFLKLKADQKYALEKRLLERRIEEKYKRLRSLGFHTPRGRSAYQKQLQAIKDAELLIELQNLRGDIEAEFFGMLGREGLEKTLQPAPKLIYLNPLNQ